MFPSSVWLVTGLDPASPAWPLAGLDLTLPGQLESELEENSEETSNVICFSPLYDNLGETCPLSYHIFRDSRHEVYHGSEWPFQQNQCRTRDSKNHCYGIASCHFLGSSTRTLVPCLGCTWLSENLAAFLKEPVYAAHFKT